MRSALALALFALVGAACTAPAAVRDSATMTSDSLGTVQRELDRFSNESKRQAEIKSARIASLQRDNRGLRDELTELTALYAAIGGDEGQWVQVFKGLTSSAEGYAKVDAASTAADKALAEALAAAYTALPSPSQPLSDAAVRYAKLAQPDSLGSQLSFLQQYGRCTAFNIELARAQEAGKKGDELPKPPSSCASFLQ
jgi:hypothetical protein